MRYYIVDCRGSFGISTGKESDCKMITLDDVWNLLSELKSSQRSVFLDFLINTFSNSEDGNLRQLSEDLLEFKDEILDDTEDPLEEFFADTYTKREASEIFKVSEKTIQRAVSEGEIIPRNPGRKPLRFAFLDLYAVFGPRSSSKALRIPRYSFAASVPATRYATYSGQGLANEKQTRVDRGAFSFNDYEVIQPCSVVVNTEPRKHPGVAAL